jgi:U3 small nucleolar RNA-associated protein 5
MASPSKSKKGSQKPSKSRPPATSAISQPQVEDASHLANLSAFSPDGNLFAFVSLAVDKHRLRIYDTGRSQTIAEHVFVDSCVSSLSWSSVILSTSTGSDAPPSKKKRKKRESLGPGEENAAPQQAIALGLSNGTVEFFSAPHARVIAALSDQASTSSILSLQIANDHQSLWTTGADGYIRLWNTSKNILNGSWKMDQKAPFTSQSLRSQTEVLVANHSIRLLSFDSSSSDMEDVSDFALPKRPSTLASFTGHASPVQILQWETSQVPPRRFASMASSDRVISLWELPAEHGESQDGTMIASVQLDSDARTIAWAGQTLLAVAASGKISVFPVPSEIPPPASSSRTTHKLARLLPRSTIASKRGSGGQVVAAAFVTGEDGKIIIGRIVSGVKPVFNTIVSFYVRVHILRPEISICSPILTNPGNTYPM